MKQVLVELDDALAAELEALAPARSRRRSEFIRAAIQRALWDAKERAIEEAYRRVPDEGPAYFDPGLWDEWVVRETPEAARTKKPRRRR